MFDMRSCDIAGVVSLHPQLREDRRGNFAKLYHHAWFAEHGMMLDIAEQYCSVSTHGVVRGLHFQTPPHDHAKLVTCLDGEIFDVVVDLRRDSASYGRHHSVRLQGHERTALYIPRGCAHGFCVVSETATVLYAVGSTHAPAHDQGIAWNSAGIVWPVGRPILSDRDAALPPLQDFDSPF